MSICITQYILRFNISMTNSFSMNVCNWSHQLIRVQFNNQIRNHLFHFQILFHHSICGIRNVVHYNIQINFIWFISISIEALSHFNTVRMVQHFQNREFSIFVSFILKYFFDSYCFSRFSNCCFENYSKRSISYYFFCIICHTLLKHKDFHLN